MQRTISVALLTILSTASLLTAIATAAADERSLAQHRELASLARVRVWIDAFGK